MVNRAAEVNIEFVGDVLIISFTFYHLDASNYKEHKREITLLIEEHEKVLLDVGQLTFIDSTGLGVIISLYKNLRARGGDLKLYNATTAVSTVFNIIRLHRVIDILNTREEVLQAFDDRATACNLCCTISGRSRMGTFYRS